MHLLKLHVITYRARKACFRKRVANLVMKATFFIVYGQYNYEPTVWPSHPEAEELIAWFFSIPKMEQSKKMVNQA